MRIVITMALALSLAGCKTSEQMAMQLQGDISACQKVTIPQSQCLAALQNERNRQALLRASANSGPTFCTSNSGYTTCY